MSESPPLGDTPPEVQVDERGTGQGNGWGPGRALSPLVQKVYQRLLSQINAGSFGSDQRLPSENDLAAQMTVSRPIVRQALWVLRQEGLIYSRRGAGSFVKAKGEDARHLGFAAVGSIADIQRCYEFRLTIEPDYTYYAALRWNEAALGTIAAALSLLRDATQAGFHNEEADFAFHVAIAEAANNHYYRSSLQALEDHVGVGMKLHGISLMGSRSGLPGVFEEHLGIFAAIRSRDAEGARDAMRQHLEGSRHRVFEGRVLDLSL